MTLKCSRCREEISMGKEYLHNFKLLCEDCCLDIRLSRVRKTHWQYIRSIKTEYLRPALK